MIGVLAGHNKTAIGSFYNGIEEYQINKKIADGILEVLGDKGKLIERGEDIDAYTKLPVKINNEKVKLAVEIHCGASEDVKAGGCEAYCKSGDDFAYKLCKALNIMTAKTTGVNIVGVISVGETGRGAYLINNTKPTTIIIKPFYMSCKSDYNSFMKNIDNYCFKIADILEQALNFLDKGVE